MVKKALHSRHFLVNGRHFPTSLDWRFPRDGIIKTLRSQALSALILRRPSYFEGMGNLHRGFMRKILKELSHWHAIILLKVWVGCAMTGKEKPHYRQCREESLDLYHVLWACPNAPIPHLIGTEAPVHLIPSWKASCRSTIHILIDT